MHSDSLGLRQGPLMTIGDFSRAVRMTAKALRFYHRNDILTPAFVDDHTGYRLYAADQIADARVVKTLRELHVPVSSIREVLTAPDVAARTELLARHLLNMERRLDDTRVAVQNLRDVLTPERSRVEIVHRRLPETRAVAVSEVIDLRDLGDWFRRSIARLRRIAERTDPAATGPYGGIWPNDLFADERGTATVFLTIGAGFAERAIEADAAIVELPPVELAVATHDGSDGTIPQVYAALGEHVARHELATDAPARETYLEGFPGIDPHSITEIGWPIFRVVH
ncbi:MerR family transcriptional regulator [Agromyces tropicus]|uniref:MerR family transcriptional regulator n=1 Tax=Agromyces tropicus TaxID=555371 RepID=A0ABN2UWR0_9MICO